MPDLTPRRRLAMVAAPLLGAAFILGASAPAAAAVDAFLSVATIPGESTDDSHKDWIDVLKWNFGATVEKTSLSAGAAGGRLSCRPLTIAKKVDKATPKLYEACAKGTHFPKVQLEVVRAGDRQPAYLKIELEDVLLTHVSTGGAAGDDAPTEEVSFVYSRIAVTYLPQTATSTALPLTPIQTSFDCPDTGR